MCLAVPLLLIKVSADRTTGTASIGGLDREIGLDLVPDANIGDYLLVHAGMAIEILKEEDATTILELFRVYGDQPDQLVPGTGDSNE